MDELARRPIQNRFTSERLQRRIAYTFANRINTFAGFFKTSEEREELKRIKSEHKKQLKDYYRDSYHPKIMNLPQFRYEITLET